MARRAKKNCSKTGVNTPKTDAVAETLQKEKEIQKKQATIEELILANHDIKVSDDIEKHMDLAFLHLKTAAVKFLNVQNQDDFPWKNRKIALDEKELRDAKAELKKLKEDYQTEAKYQKEKMGRVNVEDLILAEENAAQVATPAQVGIVNVQNAVTIQREVEELAPPAPIEAVAPAQNKMEAEVIVEKKEAAPQAPQAPQASRALPAPDVLVALNKGDVEKCRTHLAAIVVGLDNIEFLQPFLLNVIKDLKALREKEKAAEARERSPEPESRESSPEVDEASELLEESPEEPKPSWQSRMRKRPAQDDNLLVVLDAKIKRLTTKNNVENARVKSAKEKTRQEMERASMEYEKELTKVRRTMKQGKKIDAYTADVKGRLDKEEKAVKEWKMRLERLRARRIESLGNQG